MLKGMFIHGGQGETTSAMEQLMQCHLYAIL